LQALAGKKKVHIFASRNRKKQKQTELRVYKIE
jgi:hypothetical protein